jgi:DNA invertase Pin-like site-specific DNA recombinase
MTVPLRAALYLRVSTARQAEHDVSIPDQKRQGEAYCASRGYELDTSNNRDFGLRSGAQGVSRWW